MASSRKRRARRSIRLASDALHRLHARGPDFKTVLRNSRAPSAQDQRDPQRLPARCASRCGHSSGCCAARASIANGEDSGKIAAAMPRVEFGCADRRSRRSRRSPPAPRSPASTASALRAPSTPARRWSGRSRRAADSSSRNRRRRARGRRASRPPASAAREPAVLISWTMAARPALIQTTMPTIEAASMANNLPRNNASIGTAAARTSMILFDFSSISWDSTMPESRIVRKNSSICPICAVSARSLASEPDEAAVVGHRESGAARSRGTAALGDDQLQLADGVGSSARPRRSGAGWSRPPVSTARTGGLRDASSRFCCAG